ncbi:hypothetical protein ACLKA6_010342 [Drosophila palustris]
MDETDLMVRLEMLDNMKGDFNAAQTSLEKLDLMELASDARALFDEAFVEVKSKLSRELVSLQRKNTDANSTTIILWRDSPADEIKAYKLDTLTYGTKSAAFLAIRTMHQLALDEEENFPIGSRIVRTHFYVDDLMSGGDSIEEVVEIKRQVKLLLSRGQFPIRKWCSNEPAVLDGEPEVDKEKLLTFDDGTGIAKALGLAVSTEQKAAQPLTPRPTETTGTREHRSYSEVARAEKFPVIPKGYPNALFSTKELSTIQEAILDVIRKQRQEAVKPFFTGCSFRPGWLLISCANRETADWLKVTVPKLWNGAQVDLVAEADMPRPQIYVGYFPKTEKHSNEDILQLLEGQNRTLRIGDWRVLNRVDRGKHIELTFSVDPTSDVQLKSLGHSAEVNDTTAASAPETAPTAQTPADSQELPRCSSSSAPSSAPEEQTTIAASSKMAGQSTSAKAAERMRSPLHGRLPTRPGKGARRSQEEAVLLGSNRGKKRAARGRKRD